MAQGVDCYSSGKVEISSIFDVPEITAFTFHHHWRRADVGCYHVGCMLVDERGSLRVRGRIVVWEGGFFLQYSQ